MPLTPSAHGVGAEREGGLHQPIDKFLLVLMHLSLGLLEQDLSYRFAVSQSTFSRIKTTRVNFLYKKLTELPIWMTKDAV